MVARSLPRFLALGAAVVVLMTMVVGVPQAQAAEVGRLVIARSDRCVDVAEGSTGDGADIVQWACNESRSQQFDVVPGNGGFSLRAVHSGKCLDVAGAGTGDGANVVQWPCHGRANQLLQWDGSSLVFKHSGKCLDVAGAGTGNGTSIIQWNCHGRANQQFRLAQANDGTRSGDGGGSANSPTSDSSPRQGALVAVHSGACVEVNGATNGTRVEQDTCVGSAKQLFQLRDAGNNKVEIRASNSGKCLHVRGASLDREAPVVLYTCNGSKNSRWSKVMTKSGIQLQVDHTGYCLDVSGASVDPGAGLIQWPCNRRSLNQTFTFTGATDPSNGRWSRVTDVGLVPVAMANTTSGKVLMWSAYDRYSFGGNRGYTETTIFNPNTGRTSDRRVSNTQHDMFCPGIANLPDGRILVSGGSSSAETSIYDPSSNSWTDARDMNIGRGYQTNVTLGDGSVLTVGGSWSGGVKAKASEIYRNGRWTELPGIVAGRNLTTADRGGQYRSDNHMWLFAWTGNRAFQAGPSKTMHWLNPAGSGSVRSAGTRGADADAMNGNAVMYDAGKILTTGGAPDYVNSPATAASHVIDLNKRAAVRRVDDLAKPRTLHSSVVLPSGEVVVVGGQRTSRLFTDREAVMEAELFDPNTETWTTLNPMSVPRTYHSGALLLADGRVLVGGGGLCGNCSTNHANVQILTPPYLLRDNGSLRRRPSINAAPAAADHGQRLTISAEGRIDEFALVRLGNSTHAVAVEQRRVALDPVDLGSGRYRVTIPSESGVVPPGSYMLFALNRRGTPSVARMITIG